MKYIKILKQLILRSFIMIFSTTLTAVDTRENREELLKLMESMSTSDKTVPFVSDKEFFNKIQEQLLKEAQNDPLANCPPLARKVLDENNLIKEIIINGLNDSEQIKIDRYEKNKKICEDIYFEFKSHPYLTGETRQQSESRSNEYLASREWMLRNIPLEDKQRLFRIHIAAIVSKLKKEAEKHQGKLMNECLSKMIEAQKENAKVINKRSILQYFIGFHWAKSMVQRFMN